MRFGKWILWFAAVGMVIVATGCRNKVTITNNAREAMAYGNYPLVLKTLLELSDRTIEGNDSVFLMLAEAYYAMSGSRTNIDAEEISDFALSPDGKSILFADLKGERIVEYSYPSLTFKREIHTGSKVFGLDFAPDGKTLAAALGNSNIALIDFESGTVTGSLTGHTSKVRDVVFLDSSHLVSGSNDRHINTWNLGSHEMTDSQRRHSKNVKSLKLSRDGDYIVSTSNDGTAIVWNFTDKVRGRESHKMKHGTNYVNDAALSPDSRFLVTVSGDRIAKVWNAKTGKWQASVRLGDTGASVEYSPDGKTVVVGGTAYVYVIDTDTWKVVAQNPALYDPVVKIQFVDDKWILFADSSDLYKMRRLTKKELIEEAREWVKSHYKK